MEYGSITVLIPSLAAIYLMTVYGLLKIAEHQGKKKPTSPSDLGKIGN